TQSRSSQTDSEFFMTAGYPAVFFCVTSAGGLGGFGGTVPAERKLAVLSTREFEIYIAFLEKICYNIEQ
ncbi:MAG: hypothetical protein II410_00050, partial [Ruminococcus sp.]|nr:hypothetical protein [Ruminococcus sp.]